MKKLNIIILNLVVAFTLTACSSHFHGPKQFANSTDVFSSLNEMGAPADFSSGGQSPLSSEFGAAYEDVFRMAELSASQAQFFIEKSDKQNGLIFASKAQRVEKHIGSFIPHVGGTTSGWVISEKRFFLITVKEIEAEKTKVAIYDKIQYECRGADGLLYSSEECRKLIIPHWPTHQQTDTQALQQFLSFVRNNLISAGLI